MGKIAIAVHGGAGPNSAYIKSNIEAYKAGIQSAIAAGYALLQQGKNAVDAVEAAVKSLEDNPLFNAGKGAALNKRKEVEMCASIMDGSSLKPGAVAIVKNVKNPVALARFVMEKTNHVYIGGMPATQLAKNNNIELEADEYFVTGYQVEQYEQAKHEEEKKDMQERAMHGTVGAVALDVHGNVAAATSTGGTEYATPGRIGDSSVIGAGTYAANEICAVSCTGDGEYIVRHSLAAQIVALVEYKGLSIPDACNFLIKQKLKDVEGDMGIIALDNKGNIGIEFNSERMHRGWQIEGEEAVALIY